MSLTYTTLAAFVVVLLASPTVHAESFSESDITVPAGDLHYHCTTNTVNVVSLRTVGHGASDDIYVSFVFIAKYKQIEKRRLTFSL